MLGFQLKSGTPPADFIYIIIAAMICAGMLLVSNGMNWMILIAERQRRKLPNRITSLEPLTTILLSVMVGKGHEGYTLMPIIRVIDYQSHCQKESTRPGRPCGIAPQSGITCSPISAAVEAFTFISVVNDFNVSNVQVIQKRCFNS